MKTWMFLMGWVWVLSGLGCEKPVDQLPVQLDESVWRAVSGDKAKQQIWLRFSETEVFKNMKAAYPAFEFLDEQISFRVVEEKLQFKLDGVPKKGGLSRVAAQVTTVVTADPLGRVAIPVVYETVPKTQGSTLNVKTMVDLQPMFKVDFDDQGNPDYIANCNNSTNSFRACMSCAFDQLYDVNDPVGFAACTVSPWACAGGAAIHCLMLPTPAEEVPDWLASSGNHFFHTQVQDQNLWILN